MGYVRDGGGVFEAPPVLELYLICCCERGEGVGAGKVFVNWHHLSDLLLSRLIAIGEIGPHLAQPVSINLAPICTTATIL